MDYANTNSEFYHHGTKGMKWGIRRYQNKDGSLTPLGRKRYGTLDGLANSDYGRKMAKKGKLITNGKSQSTASKKVSEMTDDELRSRIQSMQLQRTYNQLYSELNPPTVSKGKKFAKATFDHVVKPGFNAVGKPLVEKGVKKLSENLFGKDAAEVAKKEFEKLKREADIWEAKGKISKNKRTVDENNEYFNKKNKPKDETTETSDNSSKTDNKTSNADQKTYTGTVETPNSKGGGYKGMKWEKRQKPDIIDVEFKDVSENTVNTGRKYIDNLLLEERTSFLLEDYTR